MESVESSESPHVLSKPYLLLTGIPYFEDAGGDVWLDELWYHDVIGHMTHLSDLRIAAPRLPMPTDRSKLRKVETPYREKLTFVPLPPQRSLTESLKGSVTTARRLWSAIGDVEVVHSGVIGWPLPLGWLANPMALLRKRGLVIILESAPWRLQPGLKHDWKKKLRHHVTESLAEWTVNRADLVVSTHQGYVDTLATHPRGRTCVLPATWIKLSALRKRELVEQDWEHKTAPPLRAVFVGRLVEAKGVRVLLDAARQLAERNAPVRLDIVGQGDLLDECRAAAADSAVVGVRDAVPYGEPFFSLLREYHCLVVPTLSDEQPRVIYDAYSQGIPVIASDTTGNRGSVHHDETGWLCPTGDASSLANRLEAAANDLQSVRRAGLAAIDFAPTTTHESMHERRAELLVELFG